jgi:hypothetical protein
MVLDPAVRFRVAVLRCGSARMRTNLEDWIGATGISFVKSVPVPTMPFATNADGTCDACGNALTSRRMKKASFDAIVQALNQAQAPFLIVGGIAVIHQYP